MILVRRLAFILSLGAVMILASSCKNAIPQVSSGFTQPRFNPQINTNKVSTKTNLAAASGVAIVPGYKIKFTLGYNPMGPSVSAGPGSDNVRSSSAGVLNEQ